VIRIDAAWLIEGELAWQTALPAAPGNA